MATQSSRSFDDSQDHTEFKKKIHQYNNALAFTFVGVDINNHAIQGSGSASLYVHGALHHCMGALIPAKGVQPSYAQLYIYDPQEPNEKHIQYNPLLNPGILLDLFTTLSILHPYAKVYKQAYEERSIQIYICKFIYNRALMQDNTIFSLLMR